MTWYRPVVVNKTPGLMIDLLATCPFHKVDFVFLGLAFNSIDLDDALEFDLA